MLGHVPGRPIFTLKVAPSHGGSGPPSNTWFLGPSQVNIHSMTIGPANFAGLTVVRVSVAWRSGSVVGCINKVTLCRARLVLGWVTVFGGQTTSVFHQATRPTQPPTLSGTGNEYQPKCSDALRLGSKGRYGSFHLRICVRVQGKTV